MNKCFNCGSILYANSTFCNKCKTDLTLPQLQQDLSSGQPMSTEEISLRLQLEQLKVQQQQLEIQELQANAQMKCPKCGSTSLTGNKKGFGVGKAAVGFMAGGLIAAPVALLGLAAGNIGSKKVRITCMRCGRKFWAGKG